MLGTEGRDEVVDMLYKVLSKYLSSLQESLSSYVKQLVQFLKSSNELLITYSGMYVSPATYLLLLLRSLTNVNAYLVEPETLMYYVAPYVEGGIRRVLIISSGVDSSLIRLLDQLNLTGYEVMLISPSPIPDNVRYKVREDLLLEIKPQDLLFQHLLVGIAVSEYLNRSGVRGSRLWNELSNLNEVLKDLLTKYIGKLYEVKEFTNDIFIITSTPSMLGPAEHITYNYNARIPRYLIPLNNVKHYIKYSKKVLVISTDVEEFSIKEIIGLKIGGAVNVCELRIRTDPLTAPIYGLILSNALMMIGD